MRTIVSVNAKGGCGKSTIAMNVAAALARRGFRVLFVDMDPQAQVTQWLKAGDGFHDSGTITAALAGKESFPNVISLTGIANVWFVPSSEGLEHLSREMTDTDGYYTTFATMLASQSHRFDFTVIDAPNQISPIMESAIWPADLFIVPFESTKAVRSYANFLQLVLKIRPNEPHLILHVLSNLSKQFGLRRKVIQTMLLHGIEPALSEVRTCGWLAQVDEHGGDIFAWRPHSIGAADIGALTNEILQRLGYSGNAGGAVVSDLAPTATVQDADGRTTAPYPETPSEAPELPYRTGDALQHGEGELPHLGTFKLRGDALIPESPIAPLPEVADASPPQADSPLDLIKNFTL